MSVADVSPRALPPLGPNRRLKVPKQAERRLGNGLTVIAVRRPAVPLVELRLWMPTGRTHLARGAMLAQTMLSGTQSMTSVQIAAELQAVGGGLSAGIDPDRLMLSGAGLVTGLDRMLEILADVLTGATYPGQEVGTERDRLVDRIQVAQSQPAHLARTALLRRVYGKHPYAVQTPEPEQVRAVRPAALRRLHAERVHPADAVLVLVGDVQPERALDAAEKALAAWNGGGHTAELPPAPPLEPGPLLLVDRPGSVQSSLRIALPAVPRTHPDHAALQLANLVFGGYFSSRWVENIREDKGYTYGPHSLVEHSVAGSVLVAGAEVATEVTGPALLETTYELGRLATLPPKPDELEQARQYALGTLQLGMSTQAGLASLTSAFAGSGLRLEFLAEHAARLAKATVDDVAEVAQRYLAPTGAVTVVLGDAERIAPALSAIAPVRTEPVRP
ncbi:MULTISPECIES: M16 family metallopeptidase [Micromonospora]|uniref:Insulinase family protein n=1 Tax=Micromonospora carbonacea TaxID=47853 RepID=A0A1C4UPQ0_9ACTN|nr:MULTISPECIES: pitrilysin family protein [Micromonospora]MBB5824470.1 putative Zn-dependent peptidase [Micromonospora carbonacea]MDG4815294.1 pitrilysin family protein [Micromonospora sp. WMMD956]QLD27332.1 insulinase family protein [Micromonospora carbonacea]SCE73699.1 Predicted Zn-dependent peptidase [Micromonospora carbonacea]